jgi:hypothetical protein
MALSRTARILIAILLLAAAAFFWVNFYYQSRLAETPAQDPVTSTPPVPAPTPAEPAAAAPDADAVAVDVAATPDGATEVVATAEGEAEPAAASAVEADEAPQAATDADPALPVEAADPAPPEAGAVVVVDDPSVVVVDVPVTVSREVVIADLPFLVTSPLPVATQEAAVDEASAAAVAVTVPSRATINPFSPVVVRTPPPPTRDVPAATPVVGVVPVPAAPAGAVAATPASRAATPTPRPLAPAAPSSAGLTRELPSGSVLASTPDLLRQPRVGTVADRVDLPAITAIAVPAAEPATVAPPPTPRAPAPAVELRPVGPIAIPVATTEEPVVVVEGAGDPAAPAPETVAGTPTPNAPLPAGTTRLARYLRDYDYAFTGSVMGPVSVGVFRSQADPTPIVVALGQTLPNTEIVLTDLRGMQAELTLGDSTQILSLDLRR